MTALIRRTLLVSIALLHPLGASAQTSADFRGLPARSVVLGNVAIGAGTAGVRAWRGKRPVAPALLYGAAGGVIMSSGFALGGERFAGARLLSVHAVAVGASVARNAGRGVAPFSSLLIPVAPFVVSVSRDSAPGARHITMRIRVSAASVAALAAQLSAGQSMRVDWAESVRSGGMVLRTSHASFDEGVQCPPTYACNRAGSQRWGVVAYRDGIATPDAERATLAHESLHAAQRARDLVLFAQPASDAVGARTGAVGRTLSKYMVFDVLMPLRAVNALSERFGGSSYASWYEREARTFAPGSAGTFQPRH